MYDNLLLQKADMAIQQCRTRGWRLAVAESCTGGLIGGCLTAIAGSSDVFDRGFITYSNTAKADLLSVPEDLLRRRGAVDPDVAEAMARGALARSPADLAVAVTGIAGPGGGSSAKPVGLVYLAVARRDGHTEAHRVVFPGDRHEVRRATVAKALELLIAASAPGTA